MTFVNEDPRISVNSATGVGSWWPRSRSLASELPALLQALWSHGHDMYQVVYNPAVWHPTARGLVVSGRHVKLESRRTQDPDSICLLDNSGWGRLTMQVVSPHTDHELVEAHAPGAPVREVAWPG